ncbi:MAG: DUF1934 domain-containing protein [Clostridia bacterium]|nr:DUF1934 domain-containing protein [Clostridia bacterium]
MKCIIKIEDTHIIDGDKESSEILVQGNFTYGSDGYKVRYREEGEGYDGCFVTLSVEGDKVTMTRKGALTTEMIMEKNKLHPCAYATPVGIMDLGVYTNEVKSAVTENGGALEFGYTLSAAGNRLSENKLKITIKRG